MIERTLLVTLDRKKKKRRRRQGLTATTRGIGQKLPVLYFRERDLTPPRFLENDRNVVFKNPDMNGGGGGGDDNPDIDSDDTPGSEVSVEFRSTDMGGGGDDRDHTNQTQPGQVQLVWTGQPPDVMNVNTFVTMSFRLNSAQRTQCDCQLDLLKFGQHDLMGYALPMLPVPTNVEVIFDAQIRRTGFFKFNLVVMWDRTRVAESYSNMFRVIDNN